MKKRTKKPSSPNQPRDMDPVKLVELRGGNGPIVVQWDPEQHNETFVRLARRRHRC